jgi:hypothetical protein
MSLRFGGELRTLSRIFDVRLFFAPDSWQEPIVASANENHRRHDSSQGKILVQAWREGCQTSMPAFSAPF